MWWKWGCGALGLVVFSCGESAPLEPREGSGGSGGSTASGGRPGSAGSVQSGGQSGTGGMFFPTGGKAVEPDGPIKNPGWVYDPPPSVDGGARFCPPIPERAVYEYQEDYRDPPGCYGYLDGFNVQIVLGGTRPPGSRVAIPRASPDGCAVVCTCREISPDGGARPLQFQWVCPR